MRYAMDGRLAACLGLAGSIVCLGGTVWIAWADRVRRYATEESIRRAIAMVPENWNYYQDLAELNPKIAVTNLRRAIELNPRNVPLRIELGDYADQAGDFATAEQSFRSAVELGLTYAPRVGLAGFYYRRRNREQFVKAARSALEIAGEDTRPLFENCWELLGGSGETIFIEVIPDREEVLRQYLGYLLETRRLEAARPVARRLMAMGSGGVEDGEAVLRYCDNMLASGDAAQASAAWTWLERRGLARAPALEAAANRGFGWRYESGSGVYFEKAPGGGVGVSFSGNQPENCDLVWRYVALEPGQNYRLRVKYRTPEPDAGLRWEVLAGGKDLLGGAGALRDGGEGEKALDFEVPAEAGLGRLSLGRVLLRYERVRGTVRVEGDAEIRLAELTPR